MEELERKKQELLERHKAGTCKQEEEALIAYIYNFSAASTGDVEQESNEDVKAEIWAALPMYQERQQRNRLLRFRLFGAAAAVLIIVGLGVAYFDLYHPAHYPETAYTKKIVPGTSGATLTLSNGKKIKLSDAAKGELANEAGMRVVKMEDGSLVYEFKETGSGFNKINTLATSKGETYRVRLPDGTMVWLNAASSIQYPSSFAALRQRKIELSGEAYFEVKEDKAHPFIVKTGRQEVEVLGTHFNVNAYPDESLVKTTLLKGSVKVTAPGKSQVIKPGEQLALSEKNDLILTEVNTDMAIAWKNDEFIFDDEEIIQVMNKISRWYNIDVVYKGPKPVDRFGGSISRFDEVKKVLNMIQRTGVVNFDIQGRTIYVSR